MLTQEQIDFFKENGFLRLEQAETGMATLTEQESGSG